MRGGRENEWCLHGLCKFSSLLCNVFLLLWREVCKLIVLHANEKWKGILQTNTQTHTNAITQPFTTTSFFLHKQTLLIERTCRYHSFTLVSVAFRDKSNMKRMATASLHTSGSMLINSRWPGRALHQNKSRCRNDMIPFAPPKSHILNVISVLRKAMVFSMKLTPSVWM
jgi:hypothetical protein